MNKYVAAPCVAILLAFTMSGVPASGQVVTVYSPPVLAPQPVFAPVQAPYTVWSPPIVTTPVAPVQQSFSMPVTPAQSSFSVPVTSAPVVTPVQSSFSVPVTPVPVVVPQSVIITPRPYVPGQPVRNTLRWIAQ